MFIMKAPMPTVWEAFAGRVWAVVGIQYASIKYVGSAWWYQNPCCVLHVWNWSIHVMNKGKGGQNKET